MTTTKAGYWEGIVSVIVNCLLFVLKFWAGITTCSIALTADAWHTLSDSLSSVVVIVATKLSAKKPDDKHPFGYGRFEQIAALFIAFLLGFIAFGFVCDAIARFQTHQAAKFGTIAIAVTVVSIITKELLAQFAFYLARKTENVSIKADGWHHRSDSLSSVVVLVGIMFAKKFWWIDSALGIVISLMLFYAVIQIAHEAIRKLLGEEPTPELIAKIKEATTTHFGTNLQLHHFHIHNYVNHREITFHIKLDKNLSIEKGHHIATSIEEIVFKQFDIIATVHVEPHDFEHKAD